MQKANRDNFYPILGNSEIVVAIFTADWCNLALRFCDMADDPDCGFDGRIKYVSVDVDESPTLATEFSIRYVPTLICFKHGVAVKRNTGTIGRDRLMEYVGKLLE